MKVEMMKERGHVFAPGMNMALYFKFAGNPRVEIIKNAILKAVYSNELLCSKIEMDERGKCYYVPLRKPVIKIMQVENTKEDSWMDMVLKQQRECFDLLNGELVRFFVMTESQKAGLLIVAHHLAGDGMSFLQLAEDIMMVLGGKESLPVKPIQIHNEKDFPSCDRKRMKTVQILNKNWLKQGKIFTKEEYTCMSEKYWRNRKTKLLKKTLDKPHMDKIKELAKKERVTVNSMIMASIFMAFKKKMKMGFTADIRPEGYYGMGNYTTGLSISYQYNFRKAFWENVRNVHKAIIKELNDPIRKYFLYHFVCKLEPSLIDAAYFHAFDSFDNKLAKKTAKLFGICTESVGIHFSNLRVLPIPINAGNNMIEEAAFIPPLVPNVTCIAGAVTANDKMCITLQALEDANVEVLFEEVISRLACL